MFSYAETCSHFRETMFQSIAKELTGVMRYERQLWVDMYVKSVISRFLFNRLGEITEISPIFILSLMNCSQQDFEFFQFVKRNFIFTPNNNIIMQV